jgi:hypothetical protein
VSALPCFLSPLLFLLQSLFLPLRLLLPRLFLLPLLHRFLFLPRLFLLLLLRSDRRSPIRLVLRFAEEQEADEED